MSAADQYTAQLEAEHAALCAQIAPLERQIAALREKRRPLVEARAKVESVLSARRRLGLMSPAEREEILRQMGAVIAPAPVGTSASVRGV